MRKKRSTYSIIMFGLLNIFMQEFIFLAQLILKDLKDEMIYYTPAGDRSQLRKGKTREKSITVTCGQIQRNRAWNSVVQSFMVRTR
jgi:hypothetical protein